MEQKKVSPLMAMAYHEDITDILVIEQGYPLGLMAVLESSSANYPSQPY